MNNQSIVAEKLQEASRSVLPANAQYRDGIVLLHGTRIAVLVDGKEVIGSVCNKYTELNRANGDKILVQVKELNPRDPRANKVEVVESDVLRIVEESGWAADYLQLDAVASSPAYRIRNFGNDVECADLASLEAAIQRYRGKSVSVIDLRSGGGMVFVDVSASGEVTESYGSQRKVDLSRVFADVSA